MIYPWLEDTWSSIRRLVDRTPHALLIHGVPGIGKLELAEAFVQLLLCEQRTGSGDACGRCEACRWFRVGNHPDFRRVEPEAIARTSARQEDDESRVGSRAAKPSIEIKVDQVRELADFLYIGSHRGRLRVALVHPAESMNVHAGNSFLKSLEEPPLGAIFVLVSHQPARILPTIRSRCVALPVPLPEGPTALAWLEAQGAKDARRWLDFAGGAPLKALQIAKGGQGDAISRMLRALADDDREALVGGLSSSEELGILAEVLQKVAIDRAMSAMGAAARYGTCESTGGNRDLARPWLAYARLMGRNRMLATHPLNARLFGSEMLAAMPSEKG